MPTMPYEIVEFPILGQTRRYKQYPAGSVPASDEESLVWDYLQWAEGEVKLSRAENERLKDELKKVVAENERLKATPAEAQASAPKAGRR